MEHVRYLGEVPHGEQHAKTMPSVALGTSHPLAMQVLSTTGCDGFCQATQRAWGCSVASGVPGCFLVSLEVACGGYARGEQSQGSSLLRASAQSSVTPPEYYTVLFPPSLHDFAGELVHGFMST